VELCDLVFGVKDCVCPVCVCGRGLPFPLLPPINRHTRNPFLHQSPTAYLPQFSLNSSPDRQLTFTEFPFSYKWCFINIVRETKATPLTHANHPMPSVLKRVEPVHSLFVSAPTSSLPSPFSSSHFSPTGLQKLWWTLHCRASEETAPPPTSLQPRRSLQPPDASSLQSHPSNPSRPFYPSRFRTIIPPSITYSQ